MVAWFHLRAAAPIAIARFRQVQIRSQLLALRYCSSFAKVIGPLPFALVLAIVAEDEVVALRLFGPRPQVN